MTFRPGDVDHLFAIQVSGNVLRYDYDRIDGVLSNPVNLASDLGQALGLGFHGADLYVSRDLGAGGRRLTRLLVRAGREPEAILDVDDAKVGRTRQGRPIIAVESFEPGSALVLGAVGARGARARIREQLDRWGLRELRDYWMVA